MDKDSRNALQRATQNARRLLEREFEEQLEGIYDILPDGTILSKPGAHLDERQCLVREKIVSIISHKQAGGMSSSAAVADTIREAAFTNLNRFAALKMLEARKLLQSCISGGDQSSGFREFAGLAPGLATLPDKGYRLYLECLFDEIGCEVKVLFDRRGLASFLWPRRQAMCDLIDILNDGVLASVWSADETIGWIYQYFNGEDERKAMREASSSPRNSRELAVRNQFFTPRYVVEFLTDNTLGRIWYEMLQGETRITEICSYLLRYPDEVFFEKGDIESHYNAQKWLMGEDVQEPNAYHLSNTINGYRRLGSPDQKAMQWMEDSISNIQDGRISTMKTQSMLDLLFFLHRADRFSGGTLNCHEDEIKAIVKELQLRRERLKKEDVPKQELLKRPFFIQYRERKDPRDICVLDPACGSGHFLLYCFELLFFIYNESWHDTNAPASKTTCQSLRTDYPTIEDLHSAIPGLILSHNLHGIDIDSRAAQIASLSLWIRAQRAYSDLSISRDNRPTIRRTNIVIAEPMPGEEEMQNDFIGRLNEKYPKVLGSLVKVVFEKMKLAGEAGSLLKIEEDIHDSIAEAKEVWLREYKRAVDKHGREMLFSERDLGITEPEQFNLFDLSDTDEEFWNTAGILLIDSLHDYSKRATSNKGYKCRLFAEDIERGFAFINICSRKYDVVLMNPPFGECSNDSRDYIAIRYPRTKNDIYAAFVERGILLLFNRGMLGAITSRTGLFLSSFKEWRDSIFFSNANLVIMADLGHGIMDSATVEAAAYCLSSLKEVQQGETPAVCLRLLREENKRSILSQMVVDLNPKGKGTIHCIFPSHFKQIQGFPLAYWISSNLLGTFQKLSSFDDEFAGRETRCGLGTLDDFRFIRLRWEISHRDKHKEWVPYFSGGSFSPFYEDFPTLVLWSNNGREIKIFVTQKVGSASRKVQGEDHYFKPGFVFPRRTRAFAPKIMPSGGIFSTAGQAGFLPKDDLYFGIGLLSSSVCNELISLSQGAGGAPQFEVGLVKRMPWPKISAEIKKKLEESFYNIVNCKRINDQHSETASIFYAPSVLSSNKRSLQDAISGVLSERKRRQNDIILEQDQIDNLAIEAYGLRHSDILNICESNMSEVLETNEAVNSNHHDEDDDERYELISSLISYIIGIIVGRWDIRIVINKLFGPRLPDPFAPLPVCPPGMLIGPDGLPAEPDGITGKEWILSRSGANSLPQTGSIKRTTISDSEYPIEICWSGILVDDPGHPDDIINRVRQVFNVIWKSESNEVYAEAIDILDPSIDDLRPWFRANFFANHIKRYSKSRRKAPIYWCLSTPSREYTVWIYYQRLSRDILYKVLNEYVKPKLLLEERKLTAMRVEIGSTPTSTQRKQIAEQEKYVAELKTFHEEVSLIAPLWKPDHNDGVVINFAPLWRLAPHPSSWQKECKQTWDSLVRGDYDWSHLAMHLWPERVVPKCHNDRSLAIAHDLEEMLWEQDKDGKWKPRDLSRSELNDLIDARTSKSVKDALEKLQAAPLTTVGGSRRRRN
ncbi:MAG: BREX-1 system adenine-specific DNA-methyltransferase PglX [Syntrophales bacterium]